MIQHGYTLYNDFEMDNAISKNKKYASLGWINQLMEKCGVIGGEKDVQTHTRIATDAKKREFPFHKIDRSGDEPEPFSNGEHSTGQDFIKQMKTRPTAVFFGDRMKRFVDHLDEGDYRCKLFDQGLVKELYVFQKSYLKYLTDNFRLLGTQTFTLNEIKDFVPDVVVFYGAPEKVISYPQIGYFDLDGPNGKIKTLVTPLKRKVDYFGDIKKPRLTMINEKVKELGGMPVHGSLFVVEEDDGSIFVVQISGDSGVGKSEMLAALMLKWMRKDLKVTAVTVKYIHDIPISRVSKKCSLEMWVIGAGCLFLTLSMRFTVQDEILGIGIASYSGIIPGEIAGCEHNINLERHRDITES